MSRSFKKHPKGKSAWGPANFSEKDWKQSYNRKVRRKISAIMTSFHPDDLDDMVLPVRHIEFGNNYDSKTDGSKRWFGDLLQNKIEFYQNYCIDYKNSICIYIDKNNVEQVIKENNIKQILSDSIVWHINMWGQYYYRPIVNYYLVQTMEDNITENHKLYAKMMRK